MKKLIVGLLVVASLALPMAATGTTQSTSSCVPVANQPSIHNSYGKGTGWTSGCAGDSYAYTLKMILDNGVALTKIQGTAVGNQYGQTNPGWCNGVNVRSQLYINVNGQGKTYTSISKFCN